jgi:hypothetical protein
MHLQRLASVETIAGGRRVKETQIQGTAVTDGSSRAGNAQVQL